MSIVTTTLTGSSRSEGSKNVAPVVLASACEWACVNQRCHSVACVNTMRAMGTSVADMRAHACYACVKHV